jgi:hypothetical protein
LTATGQSALQRRWMGRPYSLLFHEKRRPEWPRDPYPCARAERFYD